MHCSPMSCCVGVLAGEIECAFDGFGHLCRGVYRPFRRIAVGSERIWVALPVVRMPAQQQFAELVLWFDKHLCQQAQASLGKFFIGSYIKRFWAAYPSCDLWRSIRRRSPPDTRYPFIGEKKTHLCGLLVPELFAKDVGDS